MTSSYVTIVMHLRSYSSGGTTKFLTWTWTWTWFHSPSASVNQCSIHITLNTQFSTGKII